MWVKVPYLDWHPVAREDLEAWSVYKVPCGKEVKAPEAAGKTQRRKRTLTFCLWFQLPVLETRWFTR